MTENGALVSMVTVMRFANIIVNSLLSPLEVGLGVGVGTVVSREVPVE